jgi:hypothetical protein
MKIRVELNEKELRELIINYLEENIGTTFDERKINIEVKSSQNYKSEWEQADFRAIYESWE